jgi:chemotaxis protein CheY-P-specific phosphatase CheC
MPDHAYREILNAAAGEVLETMFFAAVFGEGPNLPAGSPEGSSEPPLVVARLDFLGQPSGDFYVALTEPAARSMAGNFLGAEDASELTPVSVGEVVCELANILCGAVLSRVDNLANFKLCHPELIRAMDLLSLEAATAGTTYHLGDGFLSIRLRFAAQ